ncbi:MAG: hypothetical protein ACFFBD_16830, partial [Candidatus Hodarchaeota archaeon]
MKQQEKKRGIFIVLSIILILVSSQSTFIVQVSCQSNDSFYQSLYVSQSDLQFAQTLEDKLNIDFQYFNLTEITSGQQTPPIKNREGVILIASREFSDSSNHIGSYLNSMINSRKKVVLLTPFINSISGISRQSWGMNSSFAIIPGSDLSASFSLTLNVNDSIFSDYLNETFTFEGQVAASRLHLSAQIYANITNCTGCGTDHPTFPIPLIYSMHQTNGDLLVMPLSMIQTNITGIKQLIGDKVQEIISFENIITLFIVNFFGGSLPYQNPTLTNSINPTDV